MFASSSLSVKTLIALLLALGFSCALVQTRNVHASVKNRLGDGRTMSLHCRSKDNDLGQQNVTDGSEFGWDFSPNVWGTTLFYCELRYGTLQEYYFDAYSFQRDYARCATQCLWLVATEGMYGLNGQTGFWEFAFSWPESDGAITEAAQGAS